MLLPAALQLCVSKLAILWIVKILWIYKMILDNIICKVSLESQTGWAGWCNILGSGDSPKVCPWQWIGLANLILINLNYMVMNVAKVYWPMTNCHKYFSKVQVTLMYSMQKDLGLCTCQLLPLTTTNKVYTDVHQKLLQCCTCVMWIMW